MIARACVVPQLKCVTVGLTGAGFTAGADFGPHAPKYRDVPRVAVKLEGRDCANLWKAFDSPATMRPELNASPAGSIGAAGSDLHPSRGLQVIEGQTDSPTRAHHDRAVASTQSDAGPHRGPQYEMQSDELRSPRHGPAAQLRFEAVGPVGVVDQGCRVPVRSKRVPCPQPDNSNGWTRIARPW